MKAFFALKSIMEKDMVYVTERFKVNVVCGTLEQNKWYLKCDEPKLGTADCVAFSGSEKQPMYLYLIEE
jgi:hypothetical protein